MHCAFSYISSVALRGVMHFGALAVGHFLLLTVSNECRILPHKELHFSKRYNIANEAFTSPNAITTSSYFSISFIF